MTRPALATAPPAGPLENYHPITESRLRNRCIGGLSWHDIAVGMISQLIDAR